ncbi:hypothetical protein BDEG_28115 [Batrachochytrium dendrobatidis JEL423]|uniref:Uncharacterized protein n=2 Tax=Batrachochytrium dendrobatidis (strain JEL423) TaxID=403673 RepID=A0A177WYC2_BATDL|nr:hypothetical protein BDEG_28115 [Batrachochytrium dendrobatidis JEL423]
MFRSTFVACKRAYTNYDRLQSLLGKADIKGHYKPPRQLPSENTRQSKHDQQSTQTSSLLVSQEPKSSVKNLETAKTSANHGSNSNERVLWFSDPFLLTEKLAQLVNKDKVDEAYMLLRRHTGAGNDDVHAAFFNALIKKRHYAMVIRIFKDLNAKNRTLAPQSYTSILNAIYCMAKMLPKFNIHSKKKLFDTALDVWRQLVPNLIQTNAMLSVCAACGSVGGWEMAEMIYSHIRYSNKAALTNRLVGFAAAAAVSAKALKRSQAAVASGMLSNPFEELPSPKIIVVPDVKTYTVMIGICAEIGKSVGYANGIAIWNKAVQHAAETAKLTPDDHPDIVPVKFDGPLIAKYLLLCIRSDDASHAESALDVVNLHFGFPKSHLEPYNRRHNIVESRFSKPSGKSQGRVPSSHIELTQQTFTLLMHLASRLRYPALGQHWYKIFTEELHMDADDVAMHAITTMLLTAKQFDQVWSMATEKPSKYKYQIGLRATSLAVMSREEDKEKWLDRSRTLYEEGIKIRTAKSSIEDTNMDARSQPSSSEASSHLQQPLFGFRELLNHLGTTITCKSWSEAGQIVIKNREILVDNTISRLERKVEARLKKTDKTATSDSDNEYTGDDGFQLNQKASTSNSDSDDVVFLRRGLLFSKIALEEYTNGKLGTSAQNVKAQLIMRHIDMGLGLTKTLKVKPDTNIRKLISPELYKRHLPLDDLKLDMPAEHVKGSFRRSEMGYKVQRREDVDSSTANNVSLSRSHSFSKSTLNRNSINNSTNAAQFTKKNRFE